VSDAFIRHRRPVEQIRSSSDLVRVCVALGALRTRQRLNDAEWAVVDSVSPRPIDATLLEMIRRAIRRGEDPLGEAFCRIRGSIHRRKYGAFYTPSPFVAAMTNWTLSHQPSRMVDAGCGSGRFVTAALIAGYQGSISAIDIDPHATLMTRAAVAVLRTLARVNVLNDSFLNLELPPRRRGITAFVGNPPYVRHHDLSRLTKAWSKKAATALQVHVNGMAGLHVLFLMKVARLSRRNDVLCFLSPAEWLEMPSSAGLRSLLLDQLGCVRVDEVDRRIRVFTDALVTSAITAARVGYTGPVTLRHLKETTAFELTGGEEITRETLRARSGWHSSQRPLHESTNLIPLSSYARVHRGVATGANQSFVMKESKVAMLGLERWAVPCFARASQIVQSDGIVRAADTTFRLLVLPDQLEEEVAAHIETGERQKLHRRNLCSSRTPWWRVKLPPKPAAILATYMGRRPPKFATNPDGCVALNVFHGIFFTEDVGPEVAAHLVEWLNSRGEAIAGGRTYHGGLRKFEPRDLESIMVPTLDYLLTTRLAEAIVGCES